MNVEILKDSLPNLHSADVLEKELFDKAIDFTRPLEEYPKADFIAKFLKSDVKPQHIYTESLNANGLVVQDAMEKYLESEDLSSSMLKAALKTPLDFEFTRSEDKEALAEIKGTPAYFNIGTYSHQCLLEPTKFERVIIEPKFSLASHEGCDTGIKFYEQLAREKGLKIPVIESESLQSKKNHIESLKKICDVEPVTEENYTKIKILKKRFDTYGGGILKKLLHHSKREISMYCTDPISGLNLKVRPDAIQFKENIGVDAIISIKSTGCKDLKAFYTDTAKLNYDLSEGMYQEVATQCTGRDFNTTITIMLQTVAPFHIAALVWSAEDIEMGKHKFHFAMNNAKDIMEKKSVKGYEVYSEENNCGLIQMSLPGWNQQEYLPVNI